MSKLGHISFKHDGQTFHVAKNIAEIFGAIAGPEPEIIKKLEMERLTILFQESYYQPKPNTMSDFKQYQKKQIAELRPVAIADTRENLQWNGVSISESDLKNGSPKSGDMIARNPKDHEDQWLVAEQYFKDNFEEIKEQGDFKSRLLTEQSELKQKIDKLDPYIGSEHFKTIDIEQQRLLQIQLPAMKVYYEILSRRIELL